MSESTQTSEADLCDVKRCSCVVFALKPQRKDLTNRHKSLPHPSPLSPCAPVFCRVARGFHISCMQIQHFSGWKEQLGVGGGGGGGRELQACLSSLYSVAFTSWPNKWDQRSIINCQWTQYSGRTSFWKMRTPYAGGREICVQDSEMCTKRNRETYTAFHRKRHTLPFTYSRMFRDRLRHILFETCWDRVSFLSTLYALLPRFCVQLDFYVYHTQKFALTRPLSIVHCTMKMQLNTVNAGMCQDVYLSLSVHFGCVWFLLYAPWGMKHCLSTIGMSTMHLQHG